MKKNLAIILSFIPFLLMCQKNNIENTKDIEHIKYFQKRKLIPNKDFRHINSRFASEIKASSNETLLKIKAIEYAKGQFYKVFYNKNKQITRYQFFKKDKIISSAVYYYNTNYSSRLYNKLIRIEYYNSNKMLVAYDKINYSKLGWPIKTKRYNKISNNVNLF